MHHWFQLDSISCLTGFHKMLKYSYSTKVSKTRWKLQVCYQNLFSQLLNLRIPFSLKPWMIPIVAEQNKGQEKATVLNFLRYSAHFLLQMTHIGTCSQNTSRIRKKQNSNKRQQFYNKFLMLTQTWVSHKTWSRVQQKSLQRSLKLLIVDSYYKQDCTS